MRRPVERASAAPRWAAAFEQGLAWAARGMLDRAAACFEAAARQNPHLAEAWRNLGCVRLRQGRWAQAEPPLRRAIALRQDFAEAHNDLGCAVLSQGRAQEALACFSRAIELDPGFAEAYFNLARALSETGRKEEAARACLAAVELRPSWAEALGLAACLLAALRRYREAAECAGRALALRPELPEAHNARGLALEAFGELEAALACYDAALRLSPDFAPAWNNRGNVLVRLGRLSDAERAYRQALGIRPHYGIAWNNLAHALEKQGAVEEAIACYRRALQEEPGFASAHSNLLLSLHYLPEPDRAEIYAEHRRWEQRHVPPQPAPRHSKDADPDRPLRIGYLSPDFRTHAVAYFIEPVLAVHDRRSFRVICYSNVVRADPVTARLKALADEWVEIHELSDEAAAGRIRAGEVDILVDLAGHTANGRLGIAARKPAPVIVHWLGYPDTTGLESVDYRITDEAADPPGEADSYYTEQLIRLPVPFLCYGAPREAPEVGPLPALRRGAVTFGGFHNLAKINRRVASCWGAILRRVPASRLLLKAAALDDTGARARLGRLLAESGVPLERVEMCGYAPSLRDHLAGYGEADLALDAFPYAGTTTTCEALWMGLPVVTLVGRAHVSRTGLSILKAVGLEQLAASTEDEYVEIAVSLARDPAKLADLRAGMRQRLKNSRLLRAEEFVRDLEQAYRQMWRRWCAGSGG